MKNRRRLAGIRPLLDELDDRCLLSGFSPYQPSGFTPAQITAAYGLNDISFTSSPGKTVTGNGAGETIALIEMYHDPSIQSDLAAFDTKYGLPTPSLTVVDQAGNQTDSGWALEESMDVEWRNAIAPGANILVVEAAPSYSQTQELQNLLNAVNTARNSAGVVAVSMSWGFNEMQNESSYDSYFTTPSGHQGITFVAASGDSGVVEYPSASPNVLAVGGTTLNLTSVGAYGSESSWISSGGGYSQFEQEPSYQGTVQTSGARSTPDVAFDADPNTGVEVYETNPGARSGSWQVVGGTSLGSPAWAAIIAIADQGLRGCGTQQPRRPHPDTAGPLRGWLEQFQQRDDDLLVQRVFLRRLQPVRRIVGLGLVLGRARIYPRTGLDGYDLERCNRQHIDRPRLAQRRHTDLGPRGKHAHQDAHFHRQQRQHGLGNDSHRPDDALETSQAPSRQARARRDQGHGSCGKRDRA